jgi:hypothetical protein
MTDKARVHLKKAIDLLEPNVWLELDEVSFPRFFDGPLRRGSDALEAAKAFGYQHGAVLDTSLNPARAGCGTTGAAALDRGQRSKDIDGRRSKVISQNRGCLRHESQVPPGVPLVRRPGRCHGAVMLEPN